MIPYTRIAFEKPTSRLAAAEGRIHELTTDQYK